MLTSFSSQRPDQPRHAISQERARPCQVDCVEKLDDELIAWWKKTRHENPLLASGCFHHQFADAVSRVRKGVHYAIISREGQVNGIFPVQTMRPRLLHPVGGVMNDLQGPIVDSHTRVDYANLLQKLGNRHLDFHSLVGDPAANDSGAFKRVYRVMDSPYIDLATGPEDYLAWLRKHSSTIRLHPRKTRGFVRKHGKLRLEFDCRNPDLLENVIKWKRAKYQQTRTFDILSLNWTTDFLRELFHCRDDDFKGLLSVLWAGDQPVAGHFGFQAGRRLHFYMPAHDFRFNWFSPGTELLLRLTQSARENNFDRIDLGPGQSPVKDRFANGKMIVSCGCVGLNPVVRSLKHGKFEVRQALKNIPFKEPLKKVVRPLCPGLGKRRFR